MNIPTGNRNSLSPLSIKNFVNESRNGPDLEGLTETSQQIEIKWVWNFKGNANKWSGIVQVRPIWSVCFNETVGRKEGWGRKIETKGVVGRKTIGSSSTCVCNEGSKKTRRSEVKRADLLWQVAQGRRCPNRPPIAPLSPPLCTPSPHPHTQCSSLSFSPFQKPLRGYCARCPLSLPASFSSFPSLFALDRAPRGSTTIIRKVCKLFQNGTKWKWKCWDFILSHPWIVSKATFLTWKKKKKEKQLLSYFFGKIICKTLCVRALLTFTFFQLS